MPRPSKLTDRAFYAQPAAELAQHLLGKHLVHRVDGELRSGRIVETEAYVSDEDLACHASRGRTPRTRILFGPPGHAYVYLIYGMHNLFNVVCDRDGHPAAVLVRALEPSPGLALPTNGPGRLSAALGITRAQNGLDLVGEELYLEDRGEPPVKAVATPRIGVDYAGAVWAGALLRFVDPSSRWLSKRLPARPAPGLGAGTGRRARGR